MNPLQGISQLCILVFVLQLNILPLKQLRYPQFGVPSLVLNERLHAEMCLRMEKMKAILSVLTHSFRTEHFPAIAPTLENPTFLDLQNEGFSFAKVAPFVDTRS